MLNRTVVSLPMPKARPGSAEGTASSWGALRRGLYTGPHAWLKQLVLGFIIACALTCVYLWQSSNLAAIQKDTGATRRALERLERDNVALMLQVAQLNSPAYIQERARRSGLTTERTTVVLEVPRPTATPTTAQPIAEAVLAEATALWRSLMEELLPGAAAASLTPAVAR